MARFVFVLLLLMAAFAQGTLVPRVNPLAASPDIALVVLFCWSARRNLQEGLFWAFVAGLVLDTLSLDPLGANGLALLPAVLCGLLTQRRVMHSSIVFPVALVVVATFAHAVVLSAIRHTAPDTTVLLTQALMHAVLAPVVILLFNVIDPGALDAAGR